jgi:ATP-binding cassette subfamily B (MDR/TAP) protein 1
LGKTTAIVGPSGSGKSTVVQLIERFYDPNSGQVLIDGEDLKTLNLRGFRCNVGYVG